MKRSNLSSRGRKAVRSRIARNSSSASGAREAVRENVVTYSGVGYPFYIGQTTTGTGGFVPQESAASSVSFANKIYLDPFYMGGKFQIMAALFDRYLVEKFIVVYQPLTGPTGAVLTPSGASATGNLMRTFCLEYWSDPFTSVSNLVSGINTRHIIKRTCERFAFDISREVRSQGWKFTSTTSSTPTAIDLRQVVFGCLGFNFQEASTTNSVNYGLLEVHYTVRFKDPLAYGASIGFGMVPKWGSEVVGEMKYETSKGTALSQSLSSKKCQSSYPDEKKVEQNADAPRCTCANCHLGSLGGDPIVVVEKEVFEPATPCRGTGALSVTVNKTVHNANQVGRK